MAYLVQQFMKDSLLLSLTILVCWLHVTAARAVQQKHTRPTVKRDSMPDELHVTLTGKTGTSSDVQLRLLQHSVPDVPVYTLGVDESGQYVKRLEELEVNPNVAYYHDLNNNAVMHVTRTAGRGDIEARYELQGDLAIEGQKYSLNLNKRFQRESSSSSKAESYTLIPHEPPRLASRDHRTVPSQVQLQVAEAARAISPNLGNILAGENVQRRQVGRVKQIFIDVAAVVDYVRYSRFRVNYRTEKLAIEAIRLYYAFIFSGVDMLYKSITDFRYPITVSLVRVITCKTVASSQFTLQFKFAHNFNQTDTYKAQSAFKLFVKNSSNIVNKNDHVMLFSGFDLAQVQANGIVTNRMAGLAYLSSVCKKDVKSTTIIEDRAAIHKVTTIAAHELGHSLSSSHDGDDNTCQDADGFIMASKYRIVTPTTQFNGWLFSNCSIDYFKTFITKTLRKSAGVNCLLRPKRVGKVSDVSNRLPGQEYSVDQQCRMIYDRSSRMCRTDHPSEVCTQLLCSEPGSTKCPAYTAATGTTCGNKKWCIGGRCVSDPRAPAVDDDCVFGDRPEVLENETCSYVVNLFPIVCESDLYKNMCCETCRALNRNVTDACLQIL